MTTPKSPYPFEGGCQCKRHRYKITAQPLTLYTCHCTDCQTQSSSAFGMSMPMNRPDLICDMSGLGVWTRSASSGRQVLARFCLSCGSRLFHEPSRNPSIVNVKPGTLDDTTWLRPVGHLWLARAQPWFEPLSGTLTYQGQPDTFDELYRLFAERFDQLFKDKEI